MTGTEQTGNGIEPIETDQRILDAQHDNLNLIATLQAENEEVKQQNSKLQGDNKTLTGENKSLKKKIANLEKENEALEGVNTELTNQVEELSGKEAPTAKSANSSHVSPDISKETFEVGGVKYGFAHHAVKYKGNRISASEVLASPELQQELIDKKIGLIKALD